MRPETPKLKENRRFSKNTLLIPDKNRSSVESLTGGLSRSPRKKYKTKSSQIPQIVNDYEIDKLWQK